MFAQQIAPGTIAGSIISPRTEFYLKKGAGSIFCSTNYIKDTSLCELYTFYVKCIHVHFK